MNERRRLKPDFDRARTAEACDATKLARDFKQAMRRLTAAVSIVATREQASRYGMTATALSAVCADPPAMLVCINRNATLYTSLLRTRRFSWSVVMLFQKRSKRITKHRFQPTRRVSQGQKAALFHRYK